MMECGYIKTTMQTIINYRGAKIMQQCFICQKLISTNAKSCPNCGQPWPANYGSHPVKVSIINFVVEVITPMLKFIFGLFALIGLLFALSYPAAWFWNAILADRPEFIEFFFLWCFFTVLTLFLWKVAISIINVFRTNEIVENDIKLVSISLVLGFILSGTLGFDAFRFLL